MPAEMSYNDTHHDSALMTNRQSYLHMLRSDFALTILNEYERPTKATTVRGDVDGLVTLVDENRDKLLPKIKQCTIS